tara:strand:+ start:724 stop:1512 length:789 start_codon:yes stop_codon:yes gene_type:complete
MSLTGKTLKDSYVDLLQIGNSNNGIDTATRTIQDGGGNHSALSLGDDNVAVRPKNDNTTTTFNVRSYSGSTIMQVDTTNELVYGSGNIVNTQYATFIVEPTQSSTFADDTHQAIPYYSGGYGNKSYPPSFGTGTDPATTFTTADANGTRASDLVPLLWYIQDNISIDAVTSIEGADAATGDTTRLHLFSYDFTSGATSCLTNGTLLAHNSDVTNAGSEQPYLSSWTVDSAAVASGKVILAFLKSDSINSDYSVNITVKYHLT